MSDVQIGVYVIVLVSLPRLIRSVMSSEQLWALRLEPRSLQNSLSRAFITFRVGSGPSVIACLYSLLRRALAWPAVASDNVPIDQLRCWRAW